jgi:hypothetical protein
MTNENLNNRVVFVKGKPYAISKFFHVHSGGYYKSVLQTAGNKQAMSFYINEAKTIDNVSVMSGAEFGSALTNTWRFAIQADNGNDEPDGTDICYADGTPTLETYWWDKFEFTNTLLQPGKYWLVVRYLSGTAPSASSQYWVWYLSMQSPADDDAEGSHPLGWSAGYYSGGETDIGTVRYKEYVGSAWSAKQRSAPSACIRFTDGSSIGNVYSHTYVYLSDDAHLGQFFTPTSNKVVSKIYAPFSVIATDGNTPPPDHLYWVLRMNTSTGTQLGAGIMVNKDTCKYDQNTTSSYSLNYKWYEATLPSPITLTAGQKYFLGWYTNCPGDGVRYMTDAGRTVKAGETMDEFHTTDLPPRTFQGSDNYAGVSYYPNQWNLTARVDSDAPFALEAVWPYAIDVSCSKKDVVLFRLTEYDTASKKFAFSAVSAPDNEVTITIRGLTPVTPYTISAGGSQWDELTTDSGGNLTIVHTFTTELSFSVEVSGGTIPEPSGQTVTPSDVIYPNFLYHAESGTQMFLDAVSQIGNTGDAEIVSYRSSLDGSLKSFKRDQSPRYISLDSHISVGNESSFRRLMNYLTGKQLLVALCAQDLATLGRIQNFSIDKSRGTYVPSSINITCDADTEGQCYAAFDSRLTRVGTMTVALDPASTGGYALTTSTNGSNVYIPVTQSDVVLPAGSYRMFARIKDANQVTNDVLLQVYNSTASASVASVSRTATAGYGIVVLDFNVTSSMVGHALRFIVKKNTATANTLSIDLMGFVRT